MSSSIGSCEFGIPADFWYGCTQCLWKLSRNQTFPHSDSIFTAMQRSCPTCGSDLRKLEMLSPREKKI